MKRINNQVKLAKLTRFIVFSIGIIIIYTIAEFYISTKFNISHDTLTTCVYAFFGTELASCTLIKIFNILKLNKEGDSE